MVEMDGERTAVRPKTDFWVRGVLCEGTEGAIGPVLLHHLRFKAIASV